MRKYFAWFLILAVTVAVGIAAKALAAGQRPVALRTRNLGLTLSDRVSSRAPPKTKLAPASIRAIAPIASVEGSQPATHREFVLDTGMRVINPKEIPAPASIAKR
jgi:hypothetical protein